MDDDTKAQEAIKSEYQKRYPNWSNIEVKDLIHNFQGTVAVVTAMMPDPTFQNEEICYITDDGAIKIFDTTTELLNFLHRKAQPGSLERFTARPVVAAFVFVIVLVGLFGLIVFKQSINQQALACLTSLVGVAAGFFFGSSKVQD